MHFDQPSANPSVGRTALATLLTLAAALLAAAPLQAAINFGTSTNLPAGPKPQGIAIADFNGDGKNDVALTNYGTSLTASTVDVFLGDGTGTAYTAASGSPISLTGQLGAYTVIADDFDGDGAKDLAVANLGSDTVSVLRGNGDGTFAAPVTLAMTGGAVAPATAIKEPISLAAGNFNADAKRDIVVADFGSGAGTQDVQVFLNASTGSGNIAFGTGASIATGNQAAYVATANFDNANHDDFVVSNYADFTITVYLNDGSASFTPTVYGTNDGATFAQNPAGLAIGDLNEDSHPDVIVACAGSSDQDLTARVAVFLGSASGAMGAPTLFARGDTGPLTAAVADFDGNGHQDVAVANNQGATVSLYAGDGTGALATAVNFSINNGSIGTAPFLVAAATLDSDGKPDLMTTNTDNNVAILLNTSTSGATEADLAITKTDGQTRVIPGQVLTYVVTASNAGPNAATNATVADTFPAALTPISWTCAGASGGSCTTASGTGNINNTVTLPVGGTATFTVTATVGVGATGSIVNTATVTVPGGLTDPGSSNNSATDTDTVDQAPTADAQSPTVQADSSNNALALTGSDPESDPITFAIVTQPTHGTLSGLNANTGAVNYSPTAGYSGADSFTFKVNDGLRDSTNATVSITVSPIANLGITKTDGQTRVIPGQALTYTVVVSNAGPSAAANATVADTFPASLTGVTWTCAGASGGSCTTASGSGNINNTVTLPSGGTATFTANATVAGAATGSIANTATVAAPAGTSDPTPGNNSASDTDTVDQAPTADAQSPTVQADSSNNALTLTGSDPESDPITFATVTQPTHGTLSGLNANTGAVSYTPTAGYSGADSFTFKVNDGLRDSTNATVSITVTPLANLGITKTDGATRVIPGQSLTYTLVVSNAGPSVATNAVVTDTFPASLTGVTWTCVGASGGSCTSAAGAGNISTTVTLPSGGTATFTANATVSGAASGSIANTTTVAAPAGTSDPTPGNNSATDTDTVDAAPTADAQSPTVQADSSNNALTLTGSDPESDPITFAIVTQPTHGTLSGLNVNTGAVKYTPTAGYSGADSFTFKVNDGLRDSTDATVSITVSPIANLGITKTDGQTRVGPGQSLTYTIVVSNAGPSVATDAVVTDTFPGALTGVTWTCVGASGGSCGSANGAGNINNTVTVPVGGTATFTASATVAGGASGSIANTATVAAPAGTSDPTPGNNSATDTDAVDQAPTATAQSVAVALNDPKDITLAGSDPESDSLTFQVAGAPTHGALSLISGASITYTPDTDYVGADSFTFTATDSFGRVSAPRPSPSTSSPASPASTSRPPPSS